MKKENINDLDPIKEKKSNRDAASTASVSYISLASE